MHEITEDTRFQDADTDEIIIVEQSGAGRFQATIANETLCTMRSYNDCVAYLQQVGGRRLINCGRISV